MATNPSISAPASVPHGGDGVVTVTFTLDPGTPDQPINVQLLDHAGAVLDQETVTLGGRAAEPFPTILLAGEGTPTPGQYVLRLDGADAADVLVRTGPGSFALQNR